MQKIIDFVFSYPRISNFFRGIIENGFRTTAKTIKKELDCSKKTLDIGCGTGIFSTLFLDYKGIDINLKYLEYAKKEHKKQFYAMDATNIKFKNNSFDNVLVVGILHHLGDAAVLKVASEIKRVLKKNGKALIFEDIPTKSAYNLIGKIIHFFDSGGNIRRANDYKTLLQQKLNLQKYYIITSGFCDYAVFVLSKE